MLKVKIYFGKIVFEDVNWVTLALERTVFCDHMEPLSTIEIEISWAAEWSNIRGRFYLLFIFTSWMSHACHRFLAPDSESSNTILSCIGFLRNNKIKFWMSFPYHPTATSELNFTLPPTSTSLQCQILMLCSFSLKYLREYKALVQDFNVMLVVVSGLLTLCQILSVVCFLLHSKCFLDIGPPLVNRLKPFTIACLPSFSHILWKIVAFH